MKKNVLKKLITVGLSIFVCFIAASCTSEVEVELNNDGTVNVKFEGNAGVAFEQLIRSASGVQNGTVVFNTAEITDELTMNGFTDVKAVTKTGTDLVVTMKDKNKKSTLFSSKILKIKNNAMEVELSPETLLNFYNSSDEQIVMFLDMLLAPIFNDEEMSPEEYIDVISSFYGNASADEIADSNFKVTLINTDGKKKVHYIRMTDLLTINKKVFLK